MSFSDFFVDDLISFAPAATVGHSRFPDATRWYGESFDCILRVDNRSADEIEFSCTKDCGTHSILAVSREEFNEYSRILGTDLFRVSSVSSFLEQKEKEYVFDIEETIDDLLGVIADEVDEEEEAGLEGFH